MRLRTKFYFSFPAAAFFIVAVAVALFVTASDLSNARKAHAAGATMQADLGSMKQIVYEYSRFNALRSDRQWQLLVRRISDAADFLTSDGNLRYTGAGELTARLKSADRFFEHLRANRFGDDFSERRHRIVVGKLTTILDSATARVDEIVVDARKIEIEAIDRNYYIVVLLLTLVILAAIGIVTAMINQVLPSVERIKIAAAGIGGGDLETAVGNDRDDEFGDIERSLDSMRQNIRRYQRQLDLARLDAEQANDAKSQFLANMSHELRTPLNAVIGFSDLLATLDPALTDKARVRDYAGNITQAGHHLLSLIDDLLDFAKIEARKVELSNEPFMVSEVIENIGSAFAVLAAKNDVSLEVSATETDILVNGDAVRLRQVLYNLVSNAIKFSEGGQVRIVAYADAMHGDQVRLHVEVHDSGIGIPEDRIEAIFNPFSQSDGSITRRFGGTGLGLPISRNLARLMGGDVVARSTPGEGSVFSATFELEQLPLLAPVDGDAKAAEAAPILAPGMTVLAVDDVPSNRAVIQSLLTDMGCVPKVLEHAVEAIDWVRDNHVDAILMDIHMPEIDGVAAASEIQKLPGEKRDIPIFAWTADITSENLLGDSSVRWAGTLTKPLTREVLSAALNGLADKRIAA